MLKIITFSALSALVATLLTWWVFVHQPPASVTGDTPVFGANATGMICVLMRTSEGTRWVSIPRRDVYVKR